MLQNLLNDPTALVELLLAIAAYLIWQMRLEGKVAAHAVLFKANEETFKAQAEAIKEAHREMASIRAKQEASDSILATKLEKVSIELAEIKGILRYRPNRKS